MASVQPPVTGGKIIGTPYQGSHKPGATTPASWESDNAVDISVPKGTPVYAVAAGTIGPQFGAFSGSSAYLAGLRLHLNTGANEYYYAHLSAFAPGIKPGAKVKAGQLIGYSGVANGVAHLHFAERKGSPLDIVRGLPGAVASAVSGAASAAGDAASSASSSAGLPVGCGSVLAILVLCVVLALVLPRWAKAADARTPLLDAVATAVAGHATYAYCEDSLAEWVAIGAANANGFTRPGVSPWVYLSPRQCETLRALANREDVGTYYASSALLTLVHESIHQRGGIYADPTSAAVEGLTDCAAIPLVPGIAVSYFGVPATVTEAYTATVRRRVHRRLVTSTEVRLRAVPNPWLTRLAVDVMRWHRSKPAAYQGTC